MSQSSRGAHAILHHLFGFADPGAAIDTDQFKCCPAIDVNDGGKDLAAISMFHEVASHFRNYQVYLIDLFLLEARANCHPVNLLLYGRQVAAIGNSKSDMRGI